MIAASHGSFADGNRIKKKKKRHVNTTKDEGAAGLPSESASESESDFTDTEDSTASNAKRLHETPSLLTT